MVKERLLTWTFLLVDLLIVFSLYTMGGFNFIMTQDVTYITPIIISSYVLLNIMFFLLMRSHDMYQIQHIKSIVQTLGNSFMTLGLAGTVIGFMLLLFGLFNDLDFSNTENIKLIISQMTQGMSVSLITTLTGIVTATLTHIKIALLGYE
jgi:hypothetical protein